MDISLNSELYDLWFGDSQTGDPLEFKPQSQPQPHPLSVEA